jgi:hypothetical protein
MLMLTSLAAGGSFTSQVLLPSVAFGFGLGVTFVPVTLAAVAGVPGEEAGLASGLINMTRSVGGSLGLAALATIATNRTDHLLAGRVASPHQVQVALTSGFTHAFAIGAVLVLAASLTALVALPGQPRRPRPVKPEAVEAAA